MTARDHALFVVSFDRAPDPSVFLGPDLEPGFVGGRAIQWSRQESGSIAQFAKIQIEAEGGREPIQMVFAIRRGSASDMARAHQLLREIRIPSAQEVQH